MTHTTTNNACLCYLPVKERVVKWRENKEKGDGKKRKRKNVIYVMQFDRNCQNAVITQISCHPY
jgi:hypothetical protein